MLRIYYGEHNEYCQQLNVYIEYVQIYPHMFLNIKVLGNQICSIVSHSQNHHLKLPKFYDDNNQSSYGCIAFEE